MLLTHPSPITASVVFRFGVNNETSSAYHLFKPSPPPTQNNTIAGPASWYQQQLGHLGDEPFTSPGSQPPRPLPRFAAGNPTSGPEPQPALPVDGLYRFDVDDKHLEPPNGDEDDSDGPEN